MAPPDASEAGGMRAITGDVTVVIARLHAAHGIDFAGTRRVLCRLAATGSGTVTELVEEVGVSRRRVTEVLDALGGAVERDRDAYRLPAAHAAELAAAADCAALRDDLALDGYGTLADEAPDLVAAMERHLAGLPPSLWSLDHVQATSATVVKRALFLTRRFDLRGRRVVCIGDHDLTSVAVTLACAEANAVVVDVDEKILEHVEEIARENDLPIRTVFADLRFELPPSIRESGDLVFTDPPYTAAGVELFLARGLASLRRDVGTRVVFAYDSGERQLRRALEVQQILARLRLVIRAILPAFNRYHGAEAIGSRSALWVCRPIGATWTAVDRYRAREVRIYTRGRAAEEASRPAPDAARLDEHVPEGESSVLVVATPQPRTARGRKTVSLEAFLRGEPPAGPGGVLQRACVLLADLTPDAPAYLPRILLRAPPVERAVFLVPRRSAATFGLGRRDPLRRLLAARYVLTLLPRRANDDPDVVIAEVAPPPDADASFVARFIIEHPRRHLVNAWREALVSLTDGALSKNEARSIIRDVASSGPFEGAYLPELPLSALRSLVRMIEESVDRALAR